MAIPYSYKNIPIKGGGFVTGFVFGQTAENILYARTDIGGAYRFDFKKREWQSLIDDVKATDAIRCYPLGIALDDDDPDALYLACGNHVTGTVFISHDRGESYVERPIPCGIHGNHPGRSTGERLIKKDGVIYYASQTDGLFYSKNEGVTWGSVLPNGEWDLTFVYIEQLEGVSFVLTGTTGEARAKGAKRGHSLYISYDRMDNFEPLEIPKPPANPVCEHLGFVPQRVAADGKYLYVTFAQAQRGFGGFGAISADSANMYDGRLYRYKAQDGRIVLDKDITPACIPFENGGRFEGKYIDEIKLGAGLSGVCCADGMLVVSEVGSRRAEDAIYLSTDCGETFKVILMGLEKGKINFTVPYMKPCYNGERSLIHWLSDLKINPFNHDMMLFNTGTGAFVTYNLTAAKNGGKVEFEPLCDGMEETVHLNVYSPPAGDVRCIDIVGDLGGFVFSDLDKEPENSFANESGDRYITCLNADYPDKNPEFFAATPRGNWTGKTKGGVIVTHDQGKTFKRLRYPYGISKKIDRLILDMKRPNVDSGWVAVTADGKRILWALSERFEGFNTDCVVYTDDEGEHWRRSRFYRAVSYDNEPIPIKLFSCRMDENFIWAINDKGVVFVSRNKGRSFEEQLLTGTGFFEPEKHFGQNKFDAACEPGKPHVLWIAFKNSGLIRFEYNEEQGLVESRCFTKTEDVVCGVGFGKSAPDSPYPTLYTTGILNGEYGFYRSCDLGKSFDRINTDKQCFGVITSVCGDPREFGRVYIATGSKGLITGVPTE